MAEMVSSKTAALLAFGGLALLFLLCSSGSSSSSSSSASTPLPPAALAERARLLREQQKLVVGADSHDKQIVSFSLYGSDPRYTLGAQRNAELIREIMPGWTARFYSRRSKLSPELEILLLERGAEVVFVDEGNPLVKCTMCWRFLAADDPDVARFLVRDTDSRLSLREKAAVDAWIASGRAFHIIRDHPDHTPVINGGLWAATRGFLAKSGQSMAQLLDAYFRRTGFQYSADNDFLEAEIWPLVKDNVAQHDSFHCVRFHADPIPMPRTDNRIIGGVYFGLDDRPRALDFQEMEPEPPECLPK